MLVPHLQIDRALPRHQLHFCHRLASFSCCKIATSLFVSLYLASSSSSFFFFHLLVCCLNVLLSCFLACYCPFICVCWWQRPGLCWWNVIMNEKLSFFFFVIAAGDLKKKPKKEKKKTKVYYVLGAADTAVLPALLSHGAATFPPLPRLWCVWCVAAVAFGGCMAIVCSLLPSFLIRYYFVACSLFLRYFLVSFFLPLCSLVPSVLSVVPPPFPFPLWSP